MKMTQEQKVLHSPFDIETHKKTFVNYLEVVIKEDGTIEYAVPSHQEKMIQIAMDRLKITRIELMNLCPPQYYGDFIYWLCKVSRSVSVWNDFHIGDCNGKQKAKLRRLKVNGIYHGKI